MTLRTLMLPLVAFAAIGCGDSTSEGGSHGGGTGGNGASGGAGGSGGTGGKITTACGEIFQAARCLANGWCWEAPRPQGSDFVDIDGPVDAGSLFAVGSFGAAYRRCEGAWVATVTGTEKNLRGVWHPKADYALAVGDAGLVLRWNGKSWSPLEAPTTSTLRAVWGAAPDDAWIGGDHDANGGGLFHYDGTSFERVTGVTAATVDIAAIYGRSQADVFAVGDAALRYDGTKWTELQGTSDGSYIDVLALTNGETHAMYLDGGGLALVRFDGAVWKTLHLAVPSHAFSALFEATDGHAEIVESDKDWYDDPAPQLMRNEGDSWTPTGETLPAFPSAVWARSGGEAWAVGRSSELLARAAGVWKQVAELGSIPSHPKFIGGISEQDIWAIGAYGGVAHRDAQGWSVEPVPTGGAGVIDGGGIDLQGRPWIMTAMPAEISYRDAGVWKPLSASPPWHGLGPVVNAPNDIWVADSTLSATVHHFDGVAWKSVAASCTPFHDPAALPQSPEGFRFRRDPKGVPWMVGQAGAFAFESTTTCKQLTSAGGALFADDRLVDIAWMPSGELWTITQHGKLYRREGNYLVQAGDPWSGVVNGTPNVIELFATPSGRLRITYSAQIGNTWPVSVLTIDPTSAKPVGLPMAIPESFSKSTPVVVWAPDENRTWVATRSGDVFRYDVK